MARYQLYNSLGAVTAANIKIKPGTVKHLRVTNANAAVRHFQLHEKATIPLATEVPKRSWAIPGGGVLLLGRDYWGDDGQMLGGLQATEKGMGWAVSTTAGTFTDAATAAEHSVDIGFI